jgi:hypothetical protein
MSHTVWFNEHGEVARQIVPANARQAGYYPYELYDEDELAESHEECGEYGEYDIDQAFQDGKAEGQSEYQYRIDELESERDRLRSIIEDARSELSLADDLAYA